MAAGRRTRLVMELIHLVPASGEARRYTLANGETIIGRRPDCRIVMDAPAIRHRHARLFSVDGSTIIHGIDDAWPVYVNGEPVQRRVLADGDEIELGPYRMRYVDGSRPERAHDTPTAPDPYPAGDLDTDASANEPVPGPFTPAVEDDPLPESPPVSAGEHDESEDAAPLFFNPMTATADPHESADDDDQPYPGSAESEPEEIADYPTPAAAVEQTDLPWSADETIPPTDDDAVPESTTNEALSASPAHEDELESLLDAIDPWPHPDDTDPRPVNDEIDPYQHASEPDRDSAADTIDPQPADDEFDRSSEANPTATQPAGDATDSMPSVNEDESQRAAGTRQPDAGPDYHLDILTGINQGRRVTLTQDLVVLGFNRQRLVALHNDAGALTLRRIDDEAVAHLNGAPISDEPTEARPGDVISLQRIDLRVHQS